MAALEDFLDWEFLTADDHFMLHVRSPTGEEVEYDIQRPEGLPMGVTLEPPRIRRCANHCDFCFVDGNPKEMRAPLYIRDDDYRLSFRYGNFATLPNLKPWDVDRIVEYRCHPVRVGTRTDPRYAAGCCATPTRPRSFSAPRVRGSRDQVPRADRARPRRKHGAELDRSWMICTPGETILSVSVVQLPYRIQQAQLVRQPTADDCRKALERVGLRRRAPGARLPMVLRRRDLYLRLARPYRPPNGTATSSNGERSRRGSLPATRIAPARADP